MIGIKELILSLTLALAATSPAVPTPEAAVVEQLQLEQTLIEQSGMQYLGEWNITEYCTKCNSCGARSTAIGRRAEEYHTCAVSKHNYKELAGSVLYIEGWGYFVIEDWGSVRGVADKDKWVDMFLPEKYHNKIWGKVNVWLVKGEEQ